MRSLARACLALALAIPWTGCGHACRCNAIVTAADEMAAQGKVDEAVASLLPAALGEENHEHADHLLFQAGLLLEKAGRHEEALAIWDPLLARTTSMNIAGRIVYEKGMMYRDLGRLAEAEDQFELLVTGYPENGLAYTGLLRLEALVRDRAGDQAVRELLERLLPGALESSFGDDVLWELYVWHRNHGQEEEAKAYLLAIRQSYPFPTGERSYETLFALAKMAEKEEDWQSAIDYYQEVVGPIYKSPLIGNSSGESKADAFIAMGHIYEDHLGDPETALHLYMEIVAMPDLMTKNDDGLIEAARLLAEMGKKDEACGKLADLLTNYEFSNKRKKALEMAGEIQCPVPGEFQK